VVKSDTRPHPAAQADAMTKIDALYAGMQKQFEKEKVHAPSRPQPCTRKILTSHVHAQRERKSQWAVWGLRVRARSRPRPYLCSMPII
jgi:hypothetical protein